MAADIRFKHPFTCILSGTSGSGKSSFTLRLLQHLDSLCTESNFSGGIIWCYSEKSAVPRDKLTSLHKNVSIHEGVPQNFCDDHGRTCLIILDDLLNEVYSKDVCDLFTKGSHRRNISVILITQNLFRQGRFCRDVLLNAKYSVAL
jgi:ABC-type dipeptide/oligopeptide/nickel transport system ATPase subunit